MSTPRNAKLTVVTFFAVLFYFFLGLLGDFLAGIAYHFQPGAGLPWQALWLLLLFSPVILIFLRPQVPKAVTFLLAQFVLLARVVEVMLGPQGQMILSGLGVSAFLLLFPILLHQKGQNRDRMSSVEMSAGLMLGMLLLILFRTIGDGKDITSQGWFQGIGLALWVLGVITLIGAYVDELEQIEDPITRQLPWHSPVLWPVSTGGAAKIVGLCLGLVGVMFPFAFLIAAPSLLGLWTGMHATLVMLVLLAALVLFTWAMAYRPDWRTSISPAAVLLWNGLFILSLTLCAYLYGQPGVIAFGASPGVSSALERLDQVPLIGALVLWPVLLLDFRLLADELILNRPQQRHLGGGFLLASLFILIVIVGEGLLALRGVGFLGLDGGAAQGWILSLLAGLVFWGTLLLAFRRVRDWDKVHLSHRLAVLIARSVVILAVLSLISATLVSWLS